MNTNLKNLSRTRFLQPLVALLTIFSLSAAAQNKTVTGTVTDAADGEPLIGATVSTGRNGAGAVTDFNGNFRISVPEGTRRLTFSYVGYTSKTVAIAGTRLDVKLESDQRSLGEVVVIGYGVQRKSDLTGSVSSVSGKDFNQGVVNSPEQLINGKVSGVQIVSGGGSPSAGSTIRIRGGASLNASNDPLIVLDGVPMEVGASVSGSGNFLSLINPNDIESMTILKDAASTAIYGSRASNGVILITTKKGTATKRPWISFSTTNSVAYKTRTPDMMARDEMFGLVNAQGSDAQKALINADINTDWNDVIYKKAFATDNNIGISGQLAGLLPYRLSLGYSNQDGILRTDNVTRYTGSLTLSPSLLDNHLKLVVNAKATRSDNRFANTDAIWSAATRSPFSPVHSGREAFLGYEEAADAAGVPITGATGNPLGLLCNYRSTSDVWRYVGSLDADYSLHFLPELHAHVTVGLDNSRGEGHIYVPAAAYQYYLTKGRDYDYGPQKNTNRLATVYFNYNKYFETIKSNVDVTVGYDYQYWKYTNAAYRYLPAFRLQRQSEMGDHALFQYRS